MKSILIKIGILAVLGLTIFFMGQRIHDLNIALDNSVNNEKAYAAENSGLKESNRVFKSTIEQLDYYNDSLMLAMKKIANDNGIKDKKIKSLQYQLEHYSKRDTLILRDTVFKDPNFVLDTCIIDRWNKSCLHLQYPGTIALSNEYENEKFITLSSHREPIKPRKWFLPRWFTKKQTVVEVLVVDENPYVKTKQQRFVEIIFLFMKPIGTYFLFSEDTLGTIIKSFLVS